MRTATVSIPWLTRPAGLRLDGARAADLLVSATLAAASVLAVPLALVDALLRPLRTLRLIAALRQAALSPPAELRRIWFARTARELLRLLCSAGMSDACLRRVTVRGNTGVLQQSAVLAVYHTPWGRLLGQWLQASERVVLLAGAPWATRARGVHLLSGSRGMRTLLGAIRERRCAAVTVDHFGEGGRIRRNVRVLGRPTTACIGAARLAAAGGVPLVPVHLRWRNGMLEVVLGHRLCATRETVGIAAAAVICEFDAAVRRDLSSWANAHRFLSRAS